MIDVEATEEDGEDLLEREREWLTTEVRNSEGKVRAARQRTATTVAKLAKAISEGDREDSETTGGGTDGETTVKNPATKDRRLRRAAVPDLDDDQGLDHEAEEARRAEIVRVSAELRSLVQQRFDLGHPLPQTLVAWLRTPEPAEPTSPADEMHPVGGSVLGGV